MRRVTNANILLWINLPKRLTKHFPQGNVPLRHLLNAKPPFLSWQRCAFNEVNDWAFNIIMFYNHYRIDIGTSRWTTTKSFLENKASRVIWTITIQKGVCKFWQILPIFGWQETHKLHNYMYPNNEPLKSLLLKCNGLIHLQVHHLKFTIKTEHNN